VQYQTASPHLRNTATDVVEKNAEFRSVILAGERPVGNALNNIFNIPASVMVPVAGKPALTRVMQAVKDSLQTSGGIVCGPAADVVTNSKELAEILQDPDFEWLEPAMGPAASALSALEKLGHYPTLLTSGDHALLTGEIVDDFCKQVLSHGPGCDLVLGFVPYELVQAAWPESKRTVLKFSNGKFCGSNLVAILNPEGRKALAFWCQSEADRKHPWRIARRFGPIALLRYLFRRLTLEDALQSLSTVAGCHIGHVKVNFARAAVDVDSFEDQKLAEKIMSGRR
jgi:molybdopterin-guanine dinucleotide biosynthesis protein A